LFLPENGFQLQIKNLYIFDISLKKINSIKKYEIPSGNFGRIGLCELAVRLIYLRVAKTSLKLFFPNYLYQGRSGQYKRFLKIKVTRTAKTTSSQPQFKLYPATTFAHYNSPLETHLPDIGIEAPRKIFPHDRNKLPRLDQYLFSSNYSSDSDPATIGLIRNRHSVPTMSHGVDHSDGSDWKKDQSEWSMDLSGVNSGGEGSSGVSSNKDFVQKLFRMLEEPAYKSIVRWSETGDSFVVLDVSWSAADSTVFFSNKTGQFTSEILPRHFKHSNFASFVRQLNKYDFHKVRVNPSKSGPGYGENVWEFKHPDFLLHNKDQLENIKRKVPSNKKQQVPDNVPTSQEMARVESELANLRKANRDLVGRIMTLQHDYDTALQSIGMLQKMQKYENDICQRMLTLLTLPQNPQHRQFSALLEAVRSYNPLKEVAEAQLLQRSQSQVQQEQEIQVQQSPQQSSEQSYQQTGHQLHLANQQAPFTLHSNDQLSQDMNSTNYSTVGQQASGGVPTMTSVNEANALSNSEHPPAFRVLLAEEDELSVRICRKFLNQFGCEVDVAGDGLEAVNRAQTLPYDLILINTILPSLDGVSAAELIRNFTATVPIIVMTSNVGPNIVESYYQRGITDVLAKPFSRAALFKVLSVHLSSSAVQPQEQRQLQQQPPLRSQPQTRDQVSPDYPYRKRSLEGQGAGVRLAQKKPHY
jgi:osomolarity two-component system, response regulator SKN7